VDTLPLYGKTVGPIQWSQDSRSISFVDLTAVPEQLRLHRYDLDLKQDWPRLIGEVKEVSRALVCGNTLVYVTSHQLYSVSLDSMPHYTALFSAYSVTLLACAPEYSWSQTLVGHCDPACAPEPIAFLPPDVDVRTLSLAGGNPANGESLYTALGCAGCHLAGAVAPATKGIYRRIASERLKDPGLAGMTAEQYIADSILYPNRYVMPYFSAGVMPQDYGTKLSLQELKDLIAFQMAQ
jgi:hypothetical protein